MLTTEAYNEQHNYSVEEYLLKASKEEQEENLPYYTPDVVQEYLFNLLWKRADDDSQRIEEDEQEDKDVETLFEELDDLIEEGMGNSDNEVKKFAALVSELVEQIQGKLE